MNNLSISKFSTLFALTMGLMGCVSTSVIDSEVPQATPLNDAVSTNMSSDDAPQRRVTIPDQRQTNPNQYLCELNEAEISGQCFHIGGTRWEFENHMPEGTRVTIIQFHPDGRLTGWDPNDTSYVYNNNQWVQERDVVRFWLNDRYSWYIADLGSMTEMAGEASNVNHTKWTWRARFVSNQLLAPPAF